MLCCVVSMVNFFLLLWPREKCTYWRKEPWPGGSWEGRWGGEQGGLGVWVTLSDTVSCSIPASSKQASCCFYPVVHLLVSSTRGTLEDKHPLPSQKSQRKHSQSHIQYFFLPNPSYHKEFQERTSQSGKIVRFNNSLACSNTHWILRRCCYNIISTAVHSSR